MVPILMLGNAIAKSEGGVDPSPNSVAGNILIDNTTYYQRLNVGTPIFRTSAKYGEPVRGRTWFGQFCEHVIKHPVRDIELALDHSNP